VEEIKKREVSDKTVGDRAEIGSRHLTNTIEIWSQNEQLPLCEENPDNYTARRQSAALVTANEDDDNTAGNVSFFRSEDRL
jgi:hypothetical protein